MYKQLDKTEKADSHAIPAVLLCYSEPWGCMPYDS